MTDQDQASVQSQLSTDKLTPMLRQRLGEIIQPDEEILWIGRPRCYFSIVVMAAHLRWNAPALCESVPGAQCAPSTSPRATPSLKGAYIASPTRRIGIYVCSRLLGTPPRAPAS